MLYKTFVCVLFLMTFIVSACSTGHCRRDGKEMIKKIDAKPPAGYEQEDLGSIIIGKSDGSLQCGRKAPISLEDMAERDLNGIIIIASEKRHDGLMRSAQCGQSTGMLNTYEIKHQDVLKAQKAGFTILSKSEPEPEPKKPNKKQ